MSWTIAKEKVSRGFHCFTTKTAGAFVSSIFFFVCSRLGPNYQRFLEEMKDGSPSVSEEVRWECFCLSDLITIKYS